MIFILENWVFIVYFFVYGFQGLKNQKLQLLDDEVDELDADERGDQAAEPVDQHVAAQQRVRPHWPVADAAKRQRDQQRDDQGVEDDRRGDRRRSFLRLRIGATTTFLSVPWPGVCPYPCRRLCDWG